MTICPCRRRERWAVPCICTDLPLVFVVRSSAAVSTSMPRRRSDRANEFVTLRICHRPRSLIERGEDGAGTNVVTGIGSEASRPDESSASAIISANGPSHSSSP